MPLNKLLTVETHDDVFARIGNTSNPNKIELPEGLSSYKYTQTEDGYKLLLTFKIYNTNFEFYGVGFSLELVSHDTVSGYSYTRKIYETKKMQENSYVPMR